jgi:uncharacterized protein (TIGR00297 family)
MSLLLAASLALAIALAGWIGRALTPAGALTATVVGTLILSRTGWPGMAALGAFFIGSSLISRLAPDRSVTILDAKGSTRDSMQVLANGGAAAFSTILPLSPQATLWMITASLAAAAADTWATSTGGWSRTDPRHILRWIPVPPGTSGGVTFLGTAGALLGATTVGIAAALAAGQATLLPLAVVVGTLGMLADSVLGGVWQGRFHCPACDRTSERRIHRCGAETSRTGGVAWLTNDGVNAIATLFAAALGYFAFTMFAATTS